ncbi:MAG: ABC transporter permease subunit [Nitriliruptorales bacterium]|nr:ABC transporter permease subunit [Nitriliruptorales bacterium]
MELRLLLRNGENLLVTIGIPVGLLVFFSFVDVLGVGPDAVDFLLPGMLTVGVMASAMVSLAIATGFERSYLVLKRLGATPLTRLELVIAKAAAVAVVLALQVAVLVTAALLLGWRIEAIGLGRAALVGGAALALGSAAFAGIGLTMAGRLRASSTLALANGLFVVLLLVSGVIFPLSSLPPPLARAATVLPSASLAQALRSAFAGHGSLVAPMAVVAAWAVVAPVVAARLFRWDDGG